MPRSFSEDTCPAEMQSLPASCNMLFYSGCLRCHKTTDTLRTYTTEAKSRFLKHFSGKHPFYKKMKIRMTFWKKQIGSFLWVERHWVLLLFMRTLCFPWLPLIVYLMNLIPSRVSWSKLKNV